MLNPGTVIVSTLPALLVLVNIIYIVYKIKFTLGQLLKKYRTKRNIFIVVIFGSLFIMNIIVTLGFLEVLRVEQPPDVLLRLLTSSFIFAFCLHIIMFNILDGSIRENGIFLHLNIIKWNQILFIKEYDNEIIELCVKSKTMFSKSEKKLLWNVGKQKEEILKFIHLRIESGNKL